MRHDASAGAPLSRILGHHTVGGLLVDEHDARRLARRPRVPCATRSGAASRRRGGTGCPPTDREKCATHGRPRLPVQPQADQVIRPGLREADQQVGRLLGQGASSRRQRRADPDALFIRQTLQRRTHPPQRAHEQPFFGRRHLNQPHRAAGLGLRRHRVVLLVAIGTGAEADHPRLPAERGELGQRAGHLHRPRPGQRRHLPRHREQPFHAAANRVGAAASMIARACAPARCAARARARARRRAERITACRIVDRAPRARPPASRHRPAAPASCGPRSPWFEHLADLIEIRRHDPLAHRHVLEQLGRRSEERRAVGIRHVGRGEDVAGREIARAVCLRNQAGQHGRRRRRPAGDESRSARRASARRRRSSAGARCGAQRGSRLDQPARTRAASTSAPCHGPNVPMKPITVLPSQAVALAHRATVDVRRIRSRVDAVRVHENLAARHRPAPPARPRIARLTTTIEIGGGQVELLDSRRQRFVFERAAPVAAHPDFRPVVLEDERHAAPAREPDAGIVVEAVALIDEREAARAQCALDRRDRTPGSSRSVGSSGYSQNASSGATQCTSMSGSTVGIVVGREHRPAAR